jgi:hypothetical protein
VGGFYESHPSGFGEIRMIDQDERVDELRKASETRGK